MTSQPSTSQSLSNKSDGLKLVVRKKKSSKKKLIPRSKGGLPPISLAASAGPSSASIPEESTSQEDCDELLFGPHDDNDIPCDSLLALRSLVRAQRCLFIPLHVGMIPCVLESQIYNTLKSEDGSDSVATSELRHLVSTNKIRQLLSHNGLDGVVALLESHQYCRAVWDAHRRVDGSYQSVTKWFVSALNSFTGRIVSRDQLEHSWDNSDHKSSFSVALDKLVQMQVLLPTKNDQSYLFWLPHWGSVLQEMAKAQNRVINQIKRSHYKEISQTHLESQNFPGFSTKFIIDWMLSQRFVVLHPKPSGVFLRLPQGT